MNTHISQFEASRAGFGSRFEIASLIWMRIAAMLSGALRQLRGQKQAASFERTCSSGASLGCRHN